ncbi:stevor [Plasmodium sp. gorilla clade G1]|nr:stevor [Plasmodium sp. gorilla clade G1]
MNIYYNNMLVMSFLLNVLLLSDNVNNQNKKYNVGYVKNSTRMIIMKSRRLTEIQLPKCPHYHNDPELKKIIDKLNQERIKKYIETNNSFEELHELLGKKRTNSLYENGMKKSSKMENELLKKHDDSIRDKHNVMLKSGIYTSEDIKLNDKSCEYQNKKISGDELASSHKIHDNYLDNLKKGCFGGVGICTLCSLLVSNIGIGYAVTAAKGVITPIYSLAIADKLANVLAGVYFFFSSSIENAAVSIFNLFYYDAMRAAGAATTAFLPYGIAALVLIILVVALIVLYIWLYRRRKKSWKHECKKHLCT